MGDAGGHFLGLTLGSFAVLGDVHGVPFGVSVVLLGAFLFDAVYTIGRRAQRGENVTLAHRFHLYQRLDRLGWSHGQINLAYGAVTLLLGLAGYLWTFAHPGLALRFTLAILVAMAAGSAWVEWKWSRSIGDAEPQQKVEAPG
jgi:Fuc2NAc and GlcNAc transferase